MRLHDLALAWPTYPSQIRGQCGHRPRPCRANYESIFGACIMQLRHISRFENNLPTLKQILLQVKETYSTKLHKVKTRLRELAQMPGLTRMHRLAE